MILGLPQQIKSPIASLRGWGCYMHVLSAMVADKASIVFTVDDMVSIFIEAKTKGYIFDNNLPTDGSKGEWYRAFVIEKIGFVNLVASLFGLKYKPEELYRKPTKKFDRRCEYIITEWNTLPPTSQKRASHFTISHAGIDQDPYDPWPELPRYGIMTERGWKL